MTRRICTVMVVAYTATTIGAITGLAIEVSAEAATGARLPYSVCALVVPALIIFTPRRHTPQETPT